MNCAIFHLHTVEIYILFTLDCVCTGMPISILENEHKYYLKLVMMHGRNRIRLRERCYNYVFQMHEHIEFICHNVTL